MSLIYLVEKVQLVSIGGGPLVILASGRTRTTGWTHPSLAKAVYIQPPTDGIWDFTFNADPPSGVVLDVLTPVSALYVWLDPPKGLKGVRIGAEMNAIEALISTSLRSEGPVDLKVLGGDKPYPWGPAGGENRFPRNVDFASGPCALVVGGSEVPFPWGAVQGLVCSYVSAAGANRAGALKDDPKAIGQWLGTLLSATVQSLEGEPKQRKG